MTPAVPRIRRTTAISSIVGMVAAALLVLGPAPSAGAAEGSPPVPKPDRLSMRSGSGAEIDVIANDTDPDGDDLIICRVAESKYKSISVFGAGGTELFLFAPRALSGTFTFTYYACDFDYLVPQTLTVTIKQTKRLDVQRLADHRGFMTVRNPNDALAVILFGSFRNEAPDGKKVIGPGKTIVVRVHRTRIDWVGYLRRSGADAGSGSVTGIKLPPNDPGPPPQPVGRPAPGRWLG